MKNQAGRKSKYDPLNTPILAEKYASEVLTDAQIAAKLGIHISTFMEWQKKHKEFFLAIKRGKAASNAELLKCMKKTAEGYYRVSRPFDREHTGNINGSAAFDTER